MQPSPFLLIAAYSILPVAVAAVLLFKKADRVYHPILLLLMIRLLKEITHTLMLADGHPTTFMHNQFLLVEALLLVWQFRRWQIPLGNNMTWPRLQVSIFFIWYMEHFVIGNLFATNHFLQMYTYFLVIILVLRMLLGIFEGLKDEQQTRCRLLFCSGLLMYSSIHLVLSILFFINPLAFEINNALVWWSGWINIITNFIFLKSILWVPQKPKFIMA